MTASLLGSQVPTHRLVPPCDFSRGREAVGIMRVAGIGLDPAQELILEDGMGINLGSDREETWAAREVGVEESRQNGKSVSIEARLLYGLFLAREHTLVYTAHKGKTAEQEFKRIRDIIMGTPVFRAEVARNGIHKSNGKESIELATGQTLWFGTRTSGGFRGMSVDCLACDEAQDMDDDHLAALLPLISAKSNAQLWFAGSAGGRMSIVLGRWVKRMMRKEPNLCMHRYAADENDDPADPRTWAKVNPGMGRRITQDTIAAEQRAMSATKFARERLGIGDYPRDEGEEWVIPKPAWERCEDAKSKIVGSVWIGVEVRPDQSRSSVAIGGFRRDGARHGEVVANDIGTKWVAPLVAQIKATLIKEGRKVAAVLLDPKSQAGALLGDFDDLGIAVHHVKPDEFVKGCGWLYKSATDDPPGFFHTGGTVLTQALAKAFVREGGETGGWAWSRRGDEDSTPLIAVTFAVYGPTIIRPPVKRPKPSGISAKSVQSPTADLSTIGF